MSSRNNPSYGTKATDPNAPEIQEGAGSIASDSLAAESYRAGGKFSLNRNGEPQGVSGSNSTFANENTSGATRLDPASDAEARMAQEDWVEDKKLGAASTAYPDVAGGQSKGLTVTRDGGDGQISGSAGTAPSYVNSQYTDQSRPKGKNLTEGGFDSSDSKNASFTSDIGSRNDPGRLAEQKMQRTNADAAGDAAMPRQTGISGDNDFDALGGDTSA